MQGRAVTHVYQGLHTRIGARLDARARVGFLIVAAANLLSSVACADPVTVVNSIRVGGCTGRSAGATPFAPSAALEGAARDLARKRELGRALERAGYRATSATSLHLRGLRDDASIRGLLLERSCDAIGDPRYADIGAFTDGDEIWIVLAASLPPLPRLEPDAVARRILALVNAARAAPRACGRDQLEAAPPLALSPVLSEAALAHARDMAMRGSLEHRGSDGSLPGERITRVGYAWRASGENIAAGQRDEEAVVAAWIASPAHCTVLMTSYFTDTGIAFALAPDRDPPIFWVQVFATP
jgi:uncharacterized protein YkwD